MMFAIECQCGNLLRLWVDLEPFPFTNKPLGAKWQKMGCRCGQEFTVLSKVEQPPIASTTDVASGKKLNVDVIPFVHGD